MPQREIRFGIHNGQGKRAATWKCWSPSNSEKNDVFIATREIGGALKTSFHQSGKCHIAYFREFWENKIPREHKGKSGRFIYQWELSEPIETRFILLLRIVTPYSSTTVPFEKSEYKKFHWIENCSTGKATEIYLILTLPGTTTTDWPGKRGMNSKLIGSYLLANGGTIWLIYREIEMPDFSSISLNGRFNFFKSQNKRQFVDGTKKIILFGSNLDGSQTIYDCAVEIDRKFSVFSGYIRYLNVLEKQGVKTTLPRGRFFNKFRN